MGCVYENQDYLLSVFLTESNRQITPFKYNEIDFHMSTNNLFCIYKNFNNTSGLDILFPNRTTKTIENVAYLKEESNERIVFSISSTNFGVMDPNGNVIVEPGIYKDIRNYSEGLAVVKDKNDKYGFIDVNGEIIIPIKYKDVDSFTQGITLVQTESASYLIDKKQTILVTGPKDAQRWPEMKTFKQPFFYQMGSSFDKDTKYYDINGKEIDNPKKGLFRN